MDKEIKFVAVYARVSSSLQEEQKTVEAQLGAIYDYVQSHNYVIVEKFIDEGWSGEILVRPQLDQLRAGSRDKKWDAVVIYDPDRLARNLMYQEIVIDELKGLDVEVLFVTMPPVTNSNEKLLFQVRGVFADYERTRIAERFRIGKVRRVKDNNVMLSEAPYGYTYIVNKGKRGDSDYIPGHFEINEYESQIVKDIFNWVAYERITLRGVVKKLQDLGIEPRKSKRGVWNTSTLSTLIRNETYIGRARWGSSTAVIPINPRNKNKYKKIKKSSRKILPKEKWLYIDVPPLIDKETFDRAILQLKNNFAVMGRNKKNKYLIAGKVYCSCGQRRTGEGPMKGKHLYYRCTDRVHSFPLPPNCKEKGINAKITDEIVWDRIYEIMTSKDLLMRHIKTYEESNKNVEVNNSIINIEAVMKEIEKLKKQEDRFADAYAKSVIDIEKFKEYVEPIRKKISDFENQISLSQLSKKQNNSIVVPNEDEVGAFVEKAKEELDGLSFERKQAIIGLAVGKATTTSGQKSLQVYGILNLNEIYVKLFTSDRNCRVTKCREIDAF